MKRRGRGGSQRAEGQAIAVLTVITVPDRNETGAVVDKHPALTLGQVGLLLSQSAAKFCALNPPTAEDHAWYDAWLAAGKAAGQ